MKKLLAVLVLVILILCIVVGLDAYRKVFRPYKGYGGSRTVDIPAGATVSDIARRLYHARVIPSYTYFLIYYRLFFSTTQLKSGEYEFTRRLTMKQVIEKLHRGRVVLYKITVKEGMTLRETAEYLGREHQFDAESFLREAGSPEPIRDLDPEAGDLEGYLYPETYLVPRGTTAEQMVALMVQRFKETFNHTLRWRANDIGMSVREVVILAALIEKETAHRDERFLISSVFHNRLKRGMPLGCDPTIIYILKQQNRWDGNIRWKDLEIESPYNTRIHKGLPPGPICSPGVSSIEAALYPENSEYLYFVAKDNRSHYFSKTLKEHNWAVRKFILKKNE